MGDFRKANRNFNSNQGNNSKYVVNSPWAERDEDIIDEFEKNLALMDTKIKPSPWEEGSAELKTYEQQKLAAKSYKLKPLLIEDEESKQKTEEQRRLKAKDYKYESLFDTPPLTEKERKAIESYKMNPPFQCNYNQEVIEKKASKKVNPGKFINTMKPWEVGNLPADPIPTPKFAQPTTELWEKPLKDTSAIDNMASSGDPILDSLRKQLLLHGASGIQGLSRKFRIMDDNQDGTLDQSEFIKGMKECKICDLTDKSLKHLFNYFDKDDSGVISYDEFLVGVRGVLNDRRKGLVHMAYKLLDKDKSGEVTIDDIMNVFNARSHPDVLLNKRTEKEILTEFMSSFQVGKEINDVITLNEFENYYANLSASIDSDDYFELMIRNAWHISGGIGIYENSTNKRVLVTHKDGRQSIEEIKNDLGLANDDKKGMVARLKAQGLQLASINTNGLGDMANQYEDSDDDNNNNNNNNNNNKNNNNKYSTTTNNNKYNNINNNNDISNNKYNSDNSINNNNNNMKTQRLSDFTPTSNNHNNNSNNNNNVNNIKNNIKSMVRNNNTMNSNATTVNTTSSLSNYYRK